MIKVSKKNTDYIELIKTGEDDKAIAMLYKNVLPDVQAYVKRNSGSTEDAVDIFQEGIVLLYKKVLKSEYVENTHNLSGYLFQICVNEWIRRAKKNNRFDLVSEDRLFDKAITEDLNYETGWINKEDVINIAFNGLSQKCIELLTLSIYSDLTQEDIMQRMDLNSVGAVKMQYKRCKEKLLKNISENPQILKTIKNLGR